MSSINASSSVAASLAASSSNSAKNYSSRKTTSLSGKSQLSANIRAENSIEVETPRGDQIDLSQKAQLSIESTQVTKLVIGRETGLFGSDGSNENSDSSKENNRSNKNSNSNSSNSNRTTGDKSSNSDRSQSTENTNKSLFDANSLAQSIYQDNIKLFDDYIKNNGGEVTKENVREFVDLMKRTIPEGFRQARSQLGNYDVMNDTNKSDLDSALSSVMEKMEQFEETMIGKIEAEGSINLEAKAQAGAGSNAKAA